MGVAYASPFTSNEYSRSAADRMSAPEVAHSMFHGAAIAAYQRPTDVLLLAGDFNARMRGIDERPDPAILALLEDLNAGLHGDALLGAEASLGAYEAVPPRRSADQGPANAFGHALAALAGAADLVVLNGRVAGDTQGALTFRSRTGGSMIDLFMSGPELFLRARRLGVGGEYLARRPNAPFGRAERVSDHRPVSLELDVLRHDAFRAPPPALRPPMARFDPARWREYTERFEGEPLAALNVVRDQVAAGEISAGSMLSGVTQIVEKVFRAARKAMQPASGRGRGRAGAGAKKSNHTQKRVGAPAGFGAKEGGADEPQAEGGSGNDASWWTPGCAAARKAMLLFISTSPRSPGGKLALGPDGRQELKALRSAYGRARWEGKLELQARDAEEQVQQRERDPWSVFREVFKVPQPPCKQEDMGVWGAYGVDLFGPNPAAPTAADPGAHRILNLINTAVPGGFTKFDDVPFGAATWQGSPSVAARTASAAALNGSITMDELASALGRLPYNKAAGPDAVPGEGWRCARTPAPSDPDRPGATPSMGPGWCSRYLWMS